MSKGFQIFFFLISVFLGLFGISFAITYSDVYSTENTFNWSGYTDQCSGAEIVYLPTSFNGGTLTGNTIYVFDGEYNITSNVDIENSCTALVGVELSTINIVNSSVYIISNNNIIVKGLNVYGNAPNFINGPILVSNITIDRIKVKGSNAAIGFSNASNVIIKDSVLYNNNLGISFNGLSTGFISNVLSFNNTTAGIYINNGSDISINNSAFFNSQYGLYLGGVTNLALNNSIIYNNSNMGIRNLGSIITNNSSIFNNAGNALGTLTAYGEFLSDSSLSPTLGNSTDPAVASVGWSNGSTGTISASIDNVIRPFDGTGYLFDGASSTWIGRNASFGTLSNYVFGVEVPSKIQPVYRSGSALVNAPISPSGKIGQNTSSKNSAGGGGYSSSICGNKQKESGEECDDGNTRNGDGCSSVCQIELGGICGNGRLEYLEECDDGNVVHGDGCSASCQIEETADIYQIKYGLITDYLRLKDVQDPSELIFLGIDGADELGLNCQYNDEPYHEIIFTDILDNIYQKDILTLTNYCILKGKFGEIENRSFNPEALANTAEFIKTLIKTHFLNKEISFDDINIDIKKIYSDLEQNQRYLPYFEKAYLEGLLDPLEKVDSNGGFLLNPTKEITKLKAVKTLINSLEIAGLDPKNMEKVSDTFLNPQENLTRDEMSALIKNAYQLSYEKSLLIKSKNKEIFKLIAGILGKYDINKQLDLLKKIKSAFEIIPESQLSQINILKDAFLSDISEIIRVSQNLF